MKEEKISCDKCGIEHRKQGLIRSFKDEVLDDRYWLNLAISPIEAASIGYSGRVDLCPSCSDDFYGWVNSK